MTNQRIPKDPERFFDTSALQAGLGRRSVRGGAYAGAGQAIRFVFQILWRAILARLLTPDDFGIVAMVTAVTGIILAIKDLGLTAATIQREEVTHAQVSTLFWINAAFSFAIVLIISALAPLFALWYGRPEVTLATIGIGVSFLPIGLAAQHQAILARQMRFAALMIVQVVALIVAVVVSVAAGWMGIGYWALVTFYIVQGIATGAGFWIASGWMPGMPKRGTGAREMIGFGGNLTGFNIVNYFSKRLDQILLGKFVGASALGHYDQAYRLMLQPLSQVNLPASQVAIPALSRLQNDPERYRHFYLRGMKLICLATMPALTLLVLMSNELIRVVLGPGWEMAAQLFSILGLMALVTPIANSTGWLFTSQGRTREMFHWGLISSGLTLLAIVIGLNWGAFGVAWALTITMFVIRVPWLFWYAGRKGPVSAKDLYRLMPLPSLAAAAVAASVLLYRTRFLLEKPLPDLLIATLLATLATIAVLLILPSGRRALREGKEVLAMVTSK